MDSNDRGILTLLAKGLRDLRAQVGNLSRQPAPAGKDGRDGKDGLDGKDGVGIRGLAGADGADGARGPDGPQGVPGADGERGPVGPMPKHEWRGTQLRFQQTSGKWGKWTDLQGKPGKAGSGGGGGVFVGGSGSGGDDGREVELQTGATHVQWRYVGGATWTDLVALSAITGPQGIQGIQGDPGPAGGAADIAAEIHAATSKITPVDADELGLSDSAASWGLKKLTFANLKAGLLAYLQGQFREKITAPRTYYVRTDGSDSNTGLSNTAGGAFLTVQKAVDTAASIDLGTYDVTIYVGAGTWTAATTLKTLVGAGQVVIRGVNADMTSTVVHTTGASCFDGAFAGRYRFEWLRLQTTTSGCCISAYGGGAALEWANVDFGPSVQIHVMCVSGARAESVGPYKISGGGYSHVGAYDNATLQLGAHTTTITGTPAFSGGFVVSARGASVVAVGPSFSGSATGPRYAASLNGTIITAAGVLFLPGSNLGTKDSGGQYA